MATPMMLASADLFFTARLAQNTVFFADVVGFSGSTPTRSCPNALLALNGYGARLDDPDEVNLREAWIQTQLFDQRLTLVGGRLDLTNYFDSNAVANDETTQFISDPLVVNPDARVVEQRRGLDGHLRCQWTVHLQARRPAEQRGCPKPVRSHLLARRSRTARPSVWPAGRQLPGLVPPRQQQRLEPGRVRAELRPAGDAEPFPVCALRRADAEGAEITSTAVAFNCGTDWVFNPEDAWGVGFAHIELEDDSKETLTELYYNLHLAQKLRLSGHLQYAKESPLGGPSVGYLVPGLRFQASF